MPIRGLTDRAAAFPQIGILRKGDKKPERGPGRDLTYFRFTSEHRDVIVAFYGTYGKTPKDVNVFLPYRSAGENWQAWREHWVAGGLIHRCDGETCAVWRKKDGSYSTDPVPCPGQCKPVGRLSVVIPELKRLAFVTVLTTSLHDIMTLTENLAALELLRGDLRGIPLVLRRRPRKVSTPGDNGKRLRREKWLLTLEAAPQWVSLQLAAQQAAAIPQLPSGSYELEAPDDDNGWEPPGDVVVDGTTGEIMAGPDYGDAPAAWFEEEEGPEEEAPPPAKTNGYTRPLTAEQVRTVIRKKAGWVDGARLEDGEPITEGQIGGLAGLMTKALSGMPSDMTSKARHQVLEYLFGVTKTGNLTMQEARSSIDWLKVPEENNWAINEHATAEVARILQAVAVEAGQQELPL